MVPEQTVWTLTRTFLKGKLQRELDIARVTGAADLAYSRKRYIRTRVLGSATIAIGIRTSEMGLIEKVEELRPELQFEALAKLELLEQSEIPVIQSGPTKDVSTRIPKPWAPCRQSPCKSINCEAARIEPIIDCFLARPVTGPVRTRAERAGIGKVLARQYGDREP